jgi:hypothetical protein
MDEDEYMGVSPGIGLTQEDGSLKADRDIDLIFRPLRVVSLSFTGARRKLAQVFQIGQSR